MEKWILCAEETHSCRGPLKKTRNVVILAETVDEAPWVLSFEMSQSGASESSKQRTRAVRVETNSQIMELKMVG